MSQASIPKIARHGKRANDSKLGKRQGSHRMRTPRTAGPSGTDAYVYIVVGNGATIYNSSASVLRVEFSASSAFN